MSTQVQPVTTTVGQAPQVPAAGTQAGATAPSGQYPMASLYVGDLHPDVTESMLYNKFAAVGPVLSIRVCRDAITRRSLGYAYINYSSPTDAERALETMNFDVMNNKPIRIMWSQRDPTVRRSGSGNLFIKNLDPHIDTKSIYDTFSMFGKILSCKIASDEHGKSRGYGFIHFETEESAQKAIDKVNGMMLDGKAVFVGKFQPRSVRLHDMSNPSHFTNVYVKNFADKLDEEGLRGLFEKFGTISSLVVMKDDEGKSKGFGFVSFEKAEDAEKAVKEMDEYELPETELKLTACRAQKKAEREAEKKRRYEQFKAERVQRYQGVNLFIKNLDEAVKDDELRKAFEQYGEITSAKVMLYEDGRSKGFGFVCFSKPEDATKAVVEMNSRMLASKPLYVALAQRKEDRKAQLATQYMQRMASLRAMNAPQMPVYAPTANMYGPGVLQGQRGAGFSANALPVHQMRLGNAGYGPMQNFMGQQPGHFGAQRGMPRQQLGARPQHFANSGRPSIRQPIAPVVSQPAISQPPQSFQSVPQQPQHVQGVSAPQNDFRSKLMSHSAQEQKQILGEKLYQLIGPHCSSDQVGKITGMFLEMGIQELLGMLENPALLQTRVKEAVDVLQQSGKTANV